VSIVQKQKKIPKRVYGKGLFISAVFLLSFVAIIPVKPVLAVGEGDNVLFQRFESLDSNQWKDWSKYKNDGINHDTSVVSGKLGNAAWFDDYWADWIDLGSDTSLKLDTDHFTIALWLFLGAFKPDTTAACLFHCAGGNDGNDHEQMVWLGVMESNKKVKLGFYGHAYESDIVINLGEWTHIAVTFNRSTKVAKFYRNGELNDTHTMSGRPNFYGWKGAQLGRGFYPPWDGGYFMGREDEFCVYKKLLGDSAIDELAWGDLNRKTAIENALNLGLGYIERSYFMAGNYGGDWCSMMTEFPHYPLYTNDWTGAKQMMLGQIGTEDYISVTKNTYSFSYENYTVSFKNDGWDTPKVHVWASHWLPNATGHYRTGVMVTVAECDTDHDIDLWLGGIKIFDSVQNEVGESYYHLFDGSEFGDFKVASIPGYRYTVRHGTQIARKLMMWYNENVQSGYFSSNWIDRLNNTVEYNDFDDDFYDAVVLDHDWLIYDDSADGVNWNNTVIYPHNPETPAISGDYLSDRLYHDVDIYDDMITDYPMMNGVTVWGAYPYKSRVAMSRSSYYGLSAYDCLTWAVYANHGCIKYMEYGTGGFNHGSTNIDDMEDRLRECTFDGKGMKGGVAYTLLTFGGYYTTLRLSVYSMGVTRLCTLNEWNDSDHDDWTDAKELINLLLDLQWDGEGYVYEDGQQNLVRRNMFRGGFIIAYNIGSLYYREPGAFALNVAEQVMETIGYYEPMPRNYEGYPICNMETTLAAYNALCLFYENYYGGGEW